MSDLTLAPKPSSSEPSPSDPSSAPPVPETESRSPIAGRVLTGLAAVFVLFALLMPNELGLLTPAAFLRIPVEVLLGVAVVLVLPPRAGRIVALVLGALIGLLTIIKAFDMGFFAVLERPFHPLADWPFITAGADYLGRSFGRAGEFGAVVLAIAMVVAVPVVTALAVRRLRSVVVRHRRTATRTVALLSVIWIGCAAFGVQIVAGLPVADRDESTLAYGQVDQVRTDIADHAEFASLVGVDAFRNTPGQDLLTALRGKDVIIAYVESYGRVAVTDPIIAPGVDAVLDAGTQQLRAAGFGTRTAYLTSSTYAGGSWLAHSTLESGIWINSQQRYHDLIATDRLTLTGAFHRAGWRTVAVMPANTEDWPERTFFGDDKVYDDRNLGYRGQRFTFNSMADQYTLGAFQRAERGPGHAPVMAQVVLLSSHSPWSPVPQPIDWNDIGEGFAFNTALPPTGEPTDLVRRSSDQVKADYGRTIQYSLSTLVSYVEHYGDNNLVLVLLGDHQPASIVSGDTANRDAPVTIVAHDPAVLDRVSGWGWADGMRPTPQAPVWRMDAFRDKFLTAFGP